jgi:phage terminase small subunit
MRSRPDPLASVGRPGLRTRSANPLDRVVRALSDELASFDKKGAMGRSPVVHAKRAIVEAALVIARRLASNPSARRKAA